MEQVAELYRRWPFLAGVIDNAELALARSDLGVARRYAGLPGGTRMTRHAGARGGRVRTQGPGLLASRADRLLERPPALAGRSSPAQPVRRRPVRAPARPPRPARTLPAARRARHGLGRLVRLTISGVAAGLQGTG